MEPSRRPQLELPKALAATNSPASAVVTRQSWHLTAQIPRLANDSRPWLRAQPRLSPTQKPYAKCS